jgi:Spy/CpxP family protein refolding chaperone
VSPWKVILATMVIFVCGVVTGALVVKTQVRHGPPPGFGPPGPPQLRDLFRCMDQAHLDLTAEQKSKIENIVQVSVATNAAIRKKFAPLLRAETERAQEAIKQELTPEQQIKYAELLKEQEHEQWPGIRGGRGGEGRGPWSRDTNRFPTNQSVH